MSKKSRDKKGYKGAIKESITDSYDRKNASLRCEVCGSELNEYPVAHGTMYLCSIKECKFRRVIKKDKIYE